MTILDRIQHWKDQGAISPQQQTALTNLATETPFSLGLELNVLLYAGVLAFIAGLGWTVTTWSQQLGDVVVLAVLTAILAAALWFCFTRLPAWSRAQTKASSGFLDYALYLGCLVWGIELAYLEQRLQLLSGQSDLYLLATAIVFFALAYRFDNRFVLALALSSLAGWFGLTLSHGPDGHSGPEALYRQSALIFSALITAIGFLLRRFHIKPHFFGTYLNLAANVTFWALLSGVFDRQQSSIWFFGLLAAGAASLAWGIRQREFAFVAYAAVYVYLGVSWLLLRDSRDATGVLLYFVVTAIAMLALLIVISRKFARAA